MSSSGAKYDQESGALNFSLSIANGNICYFVQTIFFFIGAIGMYMMYCEANVIANISGVSIDEYNLLFCAVALLLLNETFFIPDRWRLLCKMIASYLVWNNFESAGCSAKTLFHDTDSNSVTDATGNQVRITRAGMLFVLLAVVGSFLASYLVPNGRVKTAFSSYKFVQSSVIQAVFYCLAVVCLCVATFVQWSRGNTCAQASAGAGGTPPTNYNATLLFLGFWLIFGLCTNDANTLDIGFAIISSEVIKGRPTSFTETKIIVVYSLLFVAAFLVILGAMLHSGLSLGKFTTTGILDRVKSWGFATHIVSLLLGIAGSACIFARTSDKDQLWVAFWAGWGCPLLGIMGHVFDAEAALLPCLFYIPQAFSYYGTGFAAGSGSASYPKGEMRAGSLLLLIVPLLSTFAYYTKNIKVESLDKYLKLDGASSMRSAGLLFLASSLIWKSSSGEFWTIAFIGFVIFASSYNPQSALPKAGLLLAIERVTVKNLWLVSNDATLITLPAVILVIGFWTFIATFGGATKDMSTGLECIHEITADKKDENEHAAPLLGDEGHYTAVGDENENGDNNNSNKAPAPEPTSENTNNNNDNDGVMSPPADS